MELKKVATHTEDVCTGDILEADLNWKEKAEMISARKLIGYEMEGYAFLNYFHGRQDARGLFVKSASDHATTRTKTSDKSFQKRCAALSTAFALEMMKYVTLRDDVRATEGNSCILT